MPGCCIYISPVNIFNLVSSIILLFGSVGSGIDKSYSRCGNEGIDESPYNLNVCNNANCAAGAAGGSGTCSAAGAAGGGDGSAAGAAGGGDGSAAAGGSGTCSAAGGGDGSAAGGAAGGGDGDGSAAGGAVPPGGATGSSCIYDNISPVTSVDFIHVDNGKKLAKSSNINFCICSMLPFFAKIPRPIIIVLVYTSLGSIIYLYPSIIQHPINP